ncbi:hypothetical protein ACF3OF_00215 [Sneathia vaginalis]
MKIVVGGQIDKENVKKILNAEFPDASIDVKSDIDSRYGIKIRKL